MDNDCGIEAMPQEAMSISVRNARVWMQQLVAGCAVMLCVGASSAQDLRYLSQQTWSTEEGLPQSSVHAVAQTRDGYVWIATEGGLARFDGAGFKVFDHANESALASDDICCLTVGEGNGLWIGTGDGLVQMERGVFRRYGVEDGLPSATVVSLVEMADGSIAVQTVGGWARWNGGKFSGMSDAPAGASFIGEKGARWNYSAQGVSVVASGVSRAWRVGSELPVGRVQTVIVDRAGVAWVGMNDGLFVLRAASATATMVKAVGTISVLSIFEDVEGNHWIGTETSGLHVLRRLKFRSEPGLADRAVTSVVQTKDGAMWVGTRDDGLSRVRNGVVDIPVASSRLTSAVILCLAPDARGGLWAGTPDGLNHVSDDGTSVQRITSANGLPDDYVRSLAAGTDGSVWVGTRQGLVHSRMAGNDFKIKTLSSADGLGGDMIGSLLLAAGRDSSDLWAGTSGGLSRVSGDGVIRNFTTSDGLSSQIVTAMAKDGARGLWVATKDGGLSLLDGQRFVSVPAFVKGSGREGAIEGMSTDGAGALWFRMDRGIRRIALTTLRTCITDGTCSKQDGADGVGETFGVADGLPNDEVVAGGSSGMWLASDGELWFPTRGGVAIVDTKTLPSETSAPPVVLERFLVDDAAEDLNETSVKIPFGHARFTMEYAGLSFTTPTQVRYRFRLYGFDKGWTYAGGRRSATYTNLAPGWYRFDVEAMNEGGGWSRTGAELRFRIVPPFYRRWWFIALVLLALCGSLGGLYLLRLRRLRGRFDAVLAERNRMAREIHDTLTQDFVGTSLQLDLISQQLSRGKLELAIDQVKRARQLVTEGLEEARRSIWELRANNSQDSLPTRLTRIVEREQFAALKPRLHIGGAYRDLESRVEREVLRIAQEAMSNVLHHAQATEVFVDLHYSSDTLMLTIADNGIGFSVDDGLGKAGHYGLLGMQERASLIDGTLEISSESGQGTKITLRAPITPRRSQ